MEQIKDMQGYLKRMTNGMTDKLWFIERVQMDKIDTIVDFGCADGTLIAQLHTLFPTKNFIGYDNSIDMIYEAEELRLSSAIFTNDWLTVLHHAYGTTLLILSSVCHEMISYDNSHESWKKIKKLDPAYIAIRDMYNEDYNTSTPMDWTVSIAINLNEEESKRWAEFEKVYGNTDNLRNFVHALLKIPYKSNWAREIQEDYVSVTKGYLQEAVARSNYYTAYREEYSLPYIAQMAEKYGIHNFNVVTHQKVLLAKAATLIL